MLKNLTLYKHWLINLPVVMVKGRNGAMSKFHVTIMPAKIIALHDIITIVIKICLKHPGITPPYILRNNIFISSQNFFLCSEKQTILNKVILNCKPLPRMNKIATLSESVLSYMIIPVFIFFTPRRDIKDSFFMSLLRIFTIILIMEIHSNIYMLTKHGICRYYSCFRSVL